MHEFMVLRGSMVPYIYTYAREAYETGSSFLLFIHCLIYFIIIIRVLLKPGAGAGAGAGDEC